VRRSSLASGFFAELRARWEVEFKAEAFPDVATIRAKCLENERDEFIEGLTPDPLQSAYPRAVPGSR